MRRLACRIDTFIGNWLDLYVLRLRLSGIPISYSGHIHDIKAQRFEIRDGAEHEYTKCARCGVELYEGWRYMA